MKQSAEHLREQALTEINLNDIVRALGVENLPPLVALARWIFRSSARRFARQILEFDAQIEKHGLQAAAKALAYRYVTEIQVSGQENIPRSGALLILANHPGLSDALAILATLPRQDVRILAADRPFLQTLPALYPHLIPVPDQEPGRMAVIRQAAQHMRNGAALLNFAAGHIEPDPQALPGAVESLNTWSASIGLFARLVPQTTILPVIISGVLAISALRHPLVKLRRQRKDQEWLAAMLQILVKVWFPHVWPVRVRVDYLPPISAAQVVSLHDPQAITRAVIEYIHPYMAAITPTLPNSGQS